MRRRRGEARAALLAVDARFRRARGPLAHDVIIAAVTARYRRRLLGLWSEAGRLPAYRLIVQRPSDYRARQASWRVLFTSPCPSKAMPSQCGVELLANKASM